MKISINWNENFANWPEVRLEVDSLPELIYKRYDVEGGFYLVSELPNGIVFFVLSSPEKGGALAGKYKTQDGLVHVESGWTSNAAAVNELLGFEIVDATVWRGMSGRLCGFKASLVPGHLVKVGHMFIPSLHPTVAVKRCGDRYLRFPDYKYFPTLEEACA